MRITELQRKLKGLVPARATAPRGHLCGKIPEPAGKSIAQIGAHLRGIPFSPQGHNLINLVSTSRPDLSKVSRYVRGPRSGDAGAHPYPERFEKVVFESLDGIPLMGVMGLHRDGKKRPGVVFCHGLLGSKNKPYIMDAALEAFNSWGYNVFAPDLRNFGESQRLSHSPTTGGWKEGQDVLGACRLLGEMDGVTSVAAVGFSLGAGSVMNAAYQCAEHPYVTGGALGWSGYACMEQMTSHISRRPPLGDPFFPVYAAFICLSEIRRLEMCRGMKDEDAGPYSAFTPFSSNYRRYVREVVAPHYGLDEEAIYALSSPKEFIAEVGVPLMLIQAEDDPVCPLEEVEGLCRAAEGNPNVDVWVLPTGSHCAFEGFDTDWYWSVMRGFLDYWADRPERTDFHPLWGSVPGGDAIAV